MCEGIAQVVRESLAFLLEQLRFGRDLRAGPNHQERSERAVVDGLSLTIVRGAVMIPRPNWTQNYWPTYKAFFNNDLRRSFWFDLTVSVTYDFPLKS